MQHTHGLRRFITVIPISPMKSASGGEARHWWPDSLDKVLDAVIAKYPVDEDRIHCAGYSRLCEHILQTLLTLIARHGCPRLLEIRDCPTKRESDRKLRGTF